MDREGVGAESAEVENALDDTVQISPRETIRPESLAPIREASNSHWSALPRIVVGETIPGIPTHDTPDIFLGSTLGSGGMGEVRSGQQRSLDREVAVKSLAAGTDSALAQFLISEALLAGSLAHPGIVPVHTLGINQHGQPVLVMKKITGVAWSRLIADDDHAEWKNWESRSTDRLLVHLEILSRVCDALHFAHSRGVVHRDVKPDNIMLGQFGEVYLVDWGLAVRYEEHDPGPLAGTLGYLAPEMADKGRVTPQTDVYLLGATLHEILTRSPRHHGSSLAELLSAARESRAFDYEVSVPASLGDLANHATSRSADERPESALEFRQRIDDFFEHRSSVALSDAASARLQKLDELLLDDDPKDPGQFEVTAVQWATEARFGFDQALDLWPENSDATRGRARCLEARVEIALTRKNAAAARAAFEEISAPSSELAKRVEDLELEVAADEKKQLELMDLEYNMDSSVGKTSRRVAYIALALLAVAAAATATLMPRGLRGFTHEQSTVFALAVLVVSGGLFAAFRKQLLKNAFNRRIVVLYFATVGFMTFNRVFAWKLGIPLPRVFFVDCLLFAFGAIAGALLMRWMLILSGVFLVSAAVIAIRPIDAALIFVIATVSSALAAVLLWSRK